MTSVCITFILNNNALGFGLPMLLSTIVGITSSLAIMWYVMRISKGKGEIDLAEQQEIEKKAIETA
jgi:hypothetical protein